MIIYAVTVFCCAVLELMGENPFLDAPPKYIRATLYHYYFTKMESSNPG